MILCSPLDKSTDFKMIHSLLSMRKEDVVAMAQLWQFSIPVRLRKQEFIENYASFVLNTTDLWLKYLTRFEVELLERMVADGPESLTQTPLPSFKLTMLEMGLVVAMDIEGSSNQSTTLKMSDEMRRAIGNHAALLCKDQEQNRFWHMEECAMGLVNLFGVLTTGELMEQLAKLHPENVQEIAEVIIRSAQLQRFSIHVRGVTYFHSPMLMEVEEMIRTRNQRKELKGLKTFTVDEAIAMSRMPYPFLDTAACANLKRMFQTSLQLNPFQVEDKMETLWIQHQLRYNIPDMLVEMSEWGKVSQQNLNKLINLLTEALNTMPTWELWGLSPDEVFRQFEQPQLAKNPPHLVAGPNMRVAGMSITPQMQQMADKAWQNRAKTGRNEPCPCGSGKKYKHCCAK